MKTSGTCFSAFTASVWLSETLTIMFSRVPAGSSADAVRPIHPNSLPLLGAALCQNEIDVKCENDGWSYPTPCTIASLPSSYRCFIPLSDLCQPNCASILRRSFSLMPIVGRCL